MATKKGIVFNIKRFALHDGPGIRTTVFLKGCPMKCPWCHNPESQKKSPEKIEKNQTIGHQRSVQEVIEEIEKEMIFYDESSGGVTFSGGEPLGQPRFLGELLTECRKREIHTTLDTSGYAAPHIFKSIIDNVDLFFYDLKIMDEEKHIEFTGVSNSPVLENLKALAQMGKRVIIRFPVIPGITDAKENIKAICQFVCSLGNIEEIDLLPYHQMAGAKYHRLKKINSLEKMAVTPPSPERMEVIRHYFEDHTPSHIKIK